MKLFASLMVTGAITGLVLGGVYIQPAIANIVQQDQINLADAASDIKQGDTRRQYVNGVTKSISLESISTLWDEFDIQLVEKNKLPENLDRIIVLYQNLNSDFTQAKVTIGYLTPKIPLTHDLIALPVEGNMDVLANRGKYSVSELIDAWGHIDFRKSVDALVEVHYLNPQGQPESSQLSVYYK